MPRGSYLVTGRSEAFSCAPGPAGWRYVSDAADLACDAAFVPVRFRVGPGPDPATAAIGERATLDDGRRALVWTCPADPDRRRVTSLRPLDGGSPGLLVALLRAVAGPGDQPRAATVPVLRLDGPGFAGLAGRRSVRRLGATRHDAPDGALLAEEWAVDDPDAGTRLVAHLAGDVLLAAEGSDAAGAVTVEVTSLDGPPSWTGPPPPAGPG
ncbi:hypothetical protein [Thalassiella azotivora]